MILLSCKAHACGKPFACSLHWMSVPCFHSLHPVFLRMQS